jgi:uncharacterized protein
MHPTEFTPLSSLIGGAMIGLAAVLLMLMKGRIAGISGIAMRLFPPYRDQEFLGRFAFIGGLVLAPGLVALAKGAMPAMTIATAMPMLILAGLLVGFGAVWGNGCTSGHGVCGLGRLSIRSAAAVGVFMATAFATVFLIRHVL